MQHVGKMVLIPAERIANENSINHLSKSIQVSQQESNKDQLKKSELNSIQTLGDNLSRLDSEMYDILFSKQYNNDYEKSKNYLQVLQRYLHFKEKERKNIETDDFSNTIVNTNVQGSLENSASDSENISSVNLSSKKNFRDKSIINLSSKNNVSDKSIINSVPNSYKKKQKFY